MGEEGTKANSRVWRLSYHVNFNTYTLGVCNKKKYARRNWWIRALGWLPQSFCAWYVQSRYTILNLPKWQPPLQSVSLPKSGNSRRVLLPWSRTWTRACGIWTGRHTTIFRPPPVSDSPGRTTTAERRIDRRRLRSPVTWTVPPSRTPWRFSVCTTPAGCRRSRPRSERYRPCACEKWRPDHRRTAAAAG